MTTTQSQRETIITLRCNIPTKRHNTATKRLKLPQNNYYTCKDTQRNSKRTKMITNQLQRDIKWDKQLNITCICLGPKRDRGVFCMSEPTSPDSLIVDKVEALSSTATPPPFTFSILCAGWHCHSLSQSLSPSFLRPGAPTKDSSLNLANGHWIRQLLEFKDFPLNIFSPASLDVSLTIVWLMARALWRKWAQLQPAIQFEFLYELTTYSL